MRVFVTTLDRMLARPCLCARFLAATEPPRQLNARVVLQTDLWMVLTRPFGEPPTDFHVIAVSTQGAIVGWGMLWPEDEIGRPRGRQLSLEVRSEHRRRGVGSRIAVAARGVAGDVPVYGFSSEPAAHAFFVRQGMDPEVVVAGPCLTGSGPRG